MTLLDPRDALGRVLAATPVLEDEDVSLAEAVGRVLAEDLAADVDLPPFTRSAMDGFAVRAADVAGPPVELAVVDEILAGDVPHRPLATGQATRIMTGAPIPDGADAVVMVERTEAPSRDRVRVLAAVEAGQNVVDAASDARAGEVVLPAGTRLGPIAVGVAASVGRPRVRVHRRPRAVFLSTGDELVEVSATPGPGRIRNSNEWTFGAQIRAAGGVLERAEIVPDTLEATRAAIRRGLSSDLLVLSGGVSMGEADHVARALAEEGVEILFHKIALKPGKPLVFGRRGRTLVFGLPGNPVSSYMTFLLFVAPAVRKMTGRSDPEPRQVAARLTGRALKRIDRVQYLPAVLEATGDGFDASPLEWHGSGDLIGVTRAGAFAIVPIGTGRIEPGEAIEVVVDDGQIGPVGRCT